MGCGKAKFMGDKSAINDWLKPKIIDSLLRYFNLKETLMLFSTKILEKTLLI